MHLLGGAPISLGRLFLEGPERPQLALRLDELLDRVHSEGPDQLVFEIGVAGEEAQRFQVGMVAGCVVARLGQTPSDIGGLGDVVEPGEGGVRASGTEPAEEVADVRRPSHRDDVDSAGDEVVTPPRRECLDRRLVAGSLHEEYLVAVRDHTHPRSLPHRLVAPISIRGAASATLGPMADSEREAPEQQQRDHSDDHFVHSHRDVQGGTARAAVFGVSDGLVSNVALILGIAGASTEGSLVRLAGVSGLLAGAISMAAGEWVSVRAQNELIERELEIERKSLEENPDEETRELAAIYRYRGVRPEHAELIAEDIMSDPDVALDVHAREELGIDPGGVASPVAAAVASFWAFALGALAPLVPWFLTEGRGAVIASVAIGMVAAALVGFALASFTERSGVRTAIRQVLVAAGACTATYLIGTALGVSVA